MDDARMLQATSALCARGFLSGASPSLSLRGELSSSLQGSPGLALTATPRPGQPLPQALSLITEGSFWRAGLRPPAPAYAQIHCLPAPSTGRPAPQLDKSFRKASLQVAAAAGPCPAGDLVATTGHMINHTEWPALSFRPACRSEPQRRHLPPLLYRAAGRPRRNSGFGDAA